ncbi:hypothetical protein HPB48_022611 [Haemaphysalis longicornis]|uniref:Uncharacterized protein n=1 Tax=Haemaphysalis longicornis TaxID=44386 RepID=A0A9J6GPL7_HAELO|nr:hypothetical protein HPB48_022611 [Haemaphysalis longicornis]
MVFHSEFLPFSVFSDRCRDLIFARGGKPKKVRKDSERAPVCSRPLASRRSSADVHGAKLVVPLLCFFVQYQAKERRFQQRGEADKRRGRSIEQLLLANYFMMTTVAVHSLGRWRGCVGASRGTTGGLRRHCLTWVKPILSIALR